MRSHQLAAISFLAFLFGCMSLPAQTTVMQGQSTFLLGIFNAGDQVTVGIQSFSCDPNESGENEPVVVQASTGDLITSIGTYGFSQVFTFKASAAGTLTGFISGADFNTTFCASPFDETATVTVSTVAHPRRFSQATKDKLKATEVAVVAFGATAAAVAFVCTEIPEFVSKVCSVGGGAGAVAAGIIVAGIELALFLDPPDPNFMQIAQPTLITLPPLLPQPGNITQAEADTENALLLNMEWQIALLRAIITSENRAQSAHEAGNAFWEAQQVAAINSYASLLAVYFAGEPTLLMDVQSAIAASGDPTVTVTPAQILEFERQVALHGLPQSMMNTLIGLGADPATIAQVREFYTVQNIFTAAGTFPSFLTNPTLISTLSTASQGLGTLFSDFTAQLSVHVSDGSFEIGPHTQFTLGAGSDGINPLTEVVSLQVGRVSIIIPAGSFQSQGDHFGFDGQVNGVSIHAKITPQSDNTYQFQAEVAGVNLSDTTNPVSVVLSVGNDAGVTSALADIN